MTLRTEGFWDEHYEEELRNFEDSGDEGQVWFGKGLTRKIVARIIDKLKNDNSHDKCDMIEILDIGCGNAFLLVYLAQRVNNVLDINKARKFNYRGLDYSANSIQLSQKIVASKGLDSKIILEQCDFLDLEQVRSSTQDKKYDCVVDVGTYDAICLLASESETKLQQTRRAYMRCLYSVVKKGTVFVLASCNYTKDELMPLFQIDCPFKRSTSLAEFVETPKFQFGGKEGSQVCCLIINFE